MQPDTFFSAFTAYLPVDAFIDFTSNADTFTCTVYSRTGKRELAVPLRGKVSAKSLATAIAPFLTRELKLTPATAARLVPPAAMSDACFDAAFVARRMRGEWIDSNAGVQFKTLRRISNIRRGIPRSFAPCCWPASS